jgi:hypothetical protein
MRNNDIYLYSAVNFAAITASYCNPIHKSAVYSWLLSLYIAVQLGTGEIGILFIKITSYGLEQAAVITEDTTTKYTFKNVFIGHRSNMFWELAIIRDHTNMYGKIFRPHI